VTDDLARPIDFAAQYGAGCDRGLVLGGGGVFFIAWQTAYLAAAADAGIELRRADRVVGTSAGSLVGSLLCSGRISHLARLADLFTRAKPLVSFLAPVGQLAPSQQRALDLFAAATTNDPATLQEIGRAAMAAKTPSARTMRRNISLLVDFRGWPGDRDQLHITCVDAFTGERVVLDGHSGVRPTTAVAASSAVPGIYAPQPIHDRRCMDGGVSGTGTHSDLVAGADRAVVLSLGPERVYLQEGMTADAHAMVREMTALRESGTKVFFRSPTIPEGFDLMSPDSLAEGLLEGRAMAEEDAEELREFWG
jgi:NTE family protein